MAFWDDDCFELSKQLWIPPLELNNSKSKKVFNCPNNNISFTYLTETNYIPENRDYKFKKISTHDNTKKKDALRSRLLKTELKAHEKALKKCSNSGSKKASKKALTRKEIEKHNERLKNIKTKVSNIDKVMKCHKTNLILTYDQKLILKDWFEKATFIYNKLVKEFNTIYDEISKDHDNVKDIIKEIEKSEQFPINFIALRKLKINYFTKTYHIPYNIIANVIKQLITNIKGVFTKIKKGDIKNFRFKERSLDRSFQSIVIEKGYIKNRGFYPTFLGPIKTKDKKFKWTNINHECNVVYDYHHNTFSIQVPKYFHKKEINNRNEIAIMDPGERTFQVLYGLDHVIKIGDNIRKVITNKLLNIDNLKSKISETKNNRQKKRYIRAIGKINKKMKHLIDELHFKTNIYLCKNYDRIMVTDFSAKKVNSKEKNLNVTSKRILGVLSHYRFRQRLQNKCLEYGCEYLEVNESYTTRTCGMCGYIKNNVGANKTFNCNKCGGEIDRDINGARNILIKNRKLVLC